MQNKKSHSEDYMGMAATEVEVKDMACFAEI